MKFQSDAFNPDTFEPPTPDAQSQSAYATATSTIRYRKNPSGLLESNALFNKWSDGSATINIGDVVYELISKPLAPKDFKNYNDVLDSHTYLATPYIASQVMQIVGHVTNQYVVVPNDNLQDNAIMKLRAAMAKSGRHNDHKDGTVLISKTEDPELQKKQAEQAERERLKSQKRREAASARAEGQVGRVRGAIGAGLSLDDLEGRSRGVSAKKKRPVPRGGRKARRADYDSDDELARGRNREDEYDLEDDFVVGSDEEQEAETPEESEEEEEYEKESPKAKKQRREAPGSDVDAEGESEEEVSAAPATGGEGGGRRKRQVIEDDEDE